MFRVNTRKSVLWILVTRIFSFAIFLALLYFANMIEPQVSSGFFSSLVIFLNSNIILLFLIAFIFLAGDIVDTFAIPLNLTGPIFKAFGFVFIFAFIMNIFVFMDSLFGWSISGIVSILLAIILPIIFVIVLVFGYFLLFGKLLIVDETCKREFGKEVEKEVEKEFEKDFIDVEKVEPKPKNEKISWSDVGHEFKMTIHDFFRKVRQDMKEKK